MAALLVVGVIGLILLALTIWRPAIGCAVLALVFPVTTGIARGALIPLLRPSEAILLIVATGLIVHYLPRRRTLALSRLDYLLGGFAAGLVMIPALLLFATHYPFDISVSTQFDRWRDVFGPLQFLAFYLIFSRTDLARREVAICLNLALGASVIVGPTVIGPGARIADAYIGPYTSIGSDVRIEGAEVERSIILPGASIMHIGGRLVGSVVGRDARVFRDFSLPRALRLNVGDGGEVSLC